MRYEPAMSGWRRVLSVVLAVLACAAVSHAVPPAICREMMAGLFQADDGRVMPVELHLRMRSDENDVSFRGRFRCTAKRDRARCFIPSAVVDGFGLYAGSGRL